MGDVLKFLLDCDEHILRITNQRTNLSLTCELVTGDIEMRPWALMTPIEGPVQISLAADS